MQLPNIIDNQSPETQLESILINFRKAALSEREKGTYFEELILVYFRNEPMYKDLYSNVWTFSDWAKEQGVDGRDVGIDLVAKTAGTEEYHAIQCKFYTEDYRIQKSDIDSFFTASGKKPFVHRLIVATTNNWSEHAESALLDQTLPVEKIDLFALENSQIDWGQYKPRQQLVFKEKKRIRDHQIQALSAVRLGLQAAERGKLIMACGTGKTFTALKIAEELAGKNKRVLFLVPSLSLLSQTLTEWTQESQMPLHSFAVCSDSEIGKKRKKEDESVETFDHELRYPATTEPARLAHEMKKRHDSDHMSVVFSTYHSIDVISQSQKKHHLDDFDLIICDEAHRTTGATFDSEEESHFVKIHDANFIRGAKRLYMTATPRIFADTAKATAEKDSVALCSMDDESLYGKDLFVLTFSDAVKKDLLVDYKVIVLAVDEAHINSRLQKLLSNEENQIKVDDAAKIIGCWKALSKEGVSDHHAYTVDPMRRAVAFCQVIEYQKNAKSHKVSSKLIADMFQKVVEAYQEKADIPDPLKCEVLHVDGSMNATEKEQKLDWLKAEAADNTCRILSNVRCLSEGVDVPALDAVLFLTPRNSQVDVVQSVGRVMRKPANINGQANRKKLGYVILPVVIPAGVEAHVALNDNKTYKVVWQVLQALRSHDDRFDAMINKLDLIGSDPKKMEIIAVTERLAKKKKQKGELDIKDSGRNTYNIGKHAPKKEDEPQHNIEFEIGEIERAIYAKVVQKCGNRRHWEEWAGDIAKIANTHISRIHAIIEHPENENEIKSFRAFADELRDDLNESITNDEVVEMLAQHLITKPVFDALFGNYSFAKQNPVSLAMDKVLVVLHEHHLEKEADTLTRFYESVKLRAEGIENAQGKQKIIVELYDKFFRNAFPKMTERLGIVYTPVEVVDFIIHSVNDILKQEFNQTLGSKNVHILDPFTGTGTFITRLLQSGLIAPNEMRYKYKNEIHANEIVLLAYYIAAINIEATYHDIMMNLGIDEYEPFQGICLTDTFQLYEKDDQISQMLEDNSNRRNRQKALDIRVIICNPPYSAGQESANDNNQNVKYKTLDESIAKTYAAHSTAALQSKLYDSYIRTIRWASDRLGDSGVMGFVTNAGFVEGNAMDGLRKCLTEEFSSIYVFHLRGNARTSGEQRRKEKDNVFGQGTRTPIAISLFVKNPHAAKHGQIFFHDIGDYLSQQEKLDRIKGFTSIQGIKKENGWVDITPDKHHDWLGQRDDSFSAFICLGDKKDKNSTSIFETYSLGVSTNRDTWVYNFSNKDLVNTLQRTISFYNNEVARYSKSCVALSKDKRPNIDKFVDNDNSQISWTVNLKKDVINGKVSSYQKEKLTKGLYRPFTKNWFYFDRQWVERVLQVPRIFPDRTTANFVILINSKYSGHGFVALISNTLPDLHSNGDSQCFPLYLYDTDDDSKKSAGDDLFSAPRLRSGTEYRDPDIRDSEAARSPSGVEAKRRDAITDAGLAHFQKAYPGEKITKEDLFYYIYGLLHSPVYREKYADNLSKELPRIPAVKKAEDFWAFSKSGRALADLHINYEKVKMYPVKIVTSTALTEKHYRVEKMKFKSKDDKSTIIYNEYITVADIPLEAYEYVVNGKSAIEWIVERYCVSTHKDSGIVNDANLWATETEKNPKYILELLQRVITVSLETMKIVKELPGLEV